MTDDFIDSDKDHWRIFWHRADSASLKHVYLCAKHFHPWEVLYTCEALLPDDWILVVSFTLCICYSLSTFYSFLSFATWLHIAFTKSWFCYCIPFIEYYNVQCASSHCAVCMLTGSSDAFTMCFSLNRYIADLVLLKAPLLLFYPIVLPTFSKLLLIRLVLTLTRKR